ncbi:uncharacterized protein [Oscarella lobularis]|uniref:uncharacterized protein isoform X3 n=1 Tax=Oscarella lobularis TaxID=121494 RepID=UPI0033141B5E
MSGFTPFLFAVLHEHLEVTNVLFQRGCNIAAKTTSRNGALALASERGRLNIVRRLVEIGCNINEPHEDGYTSLHFACKNGHAQIAKFLVSSGANTKAINKFGRTPLLEAHFNKKRNVISSLKQILGSQITAEEGIDEESLSEDNRSSSDEEVENTSDEACQETADPSDRSQEIYDEALKRGSVTVNRCRVIVAGQDGTGKSCLVDSLLNRTFEKKKASTEGAAVTMTHTATRGWIATDSKDHLDPLIAEGVYRMNQQQLTSKSWQEGSSESSHFVLNSREPNVKSKDAEADKIDLSTAINHLKPAPAVETHSEDLKMFGIEAKTLTAGQLQLVKTFLTNRPSEEDLRERILGVRDIWDLGGQEVYLATHSALMPDSKAFCMSIYMIVMDISKSLSDKAQSFYRSSDGEVTDLTNELGWIRTNGDFPLYWFGSITAAHEETPMGDHWLGKDEEVAPPPVFAIGTHRDVLDNKEKFPNSDSVKEWLREQGKLFEELLSDSDFKKHIVKPRPRKDEDFREMAHFFKRIFLVDNSVSGSGSPCKGVREIRERVDRMTTTYWEKAKKQPLFWVYLEILLFQWSEVMKTVVAKVDEIVMLAQHPTICNISSRDEVLVALKYLASVGVILYYPEVEDLKDVVFTRPMWVIKALSAFVTAVEPGPLMEPQWDFLKKKGVMSNDLMMYRLKQMRDADCSDLATGQKNTDGERVEAENRLVVRLLELLDVITPVEGQKNFYVPSMLKAPFLYSFTYLERLTSSNVESRSCGLPAPLIVIPKKLKFVPECLFFRLITRFLKVYPLKPRLSRHQCIFLAQDKTPAEVLVEVELLYHKRGKWIALTIRFVNDEDREKISGQFLASIKSELHEQMKNVCMQGMRGFKYSICCQTKKAARKNEEFGIDPEDLSVIFDEDGDSSSEPPRKISKVYFNPFNEPLSRRQQEFEIDCWFEHKPICARLLSQEALPKAIDTRLIRVVAFLVNAKWDEFAVFLEASASDITQYKETSVKNLVRALNVIETWVERCGPEATVNALIKACENCGIHRHKIAAAYEENLLSERDEYFESPSQTKQRDVGEVGHAETLSLPFLHFKTGPPIDPTSFATGTEPLAWRKSLLPAPEDLILASSVPPHLLQNQSSCQVVVASSRLKDGKEERQEKAIASPKSLPAKVDVLEETVWRNVGEVLETNELVGTSKVSELVLESVEVNRFRLNVLGQIRSFVLKERRSCTVDSGGGQIHLKSSGVTVTLSENAVSEATNFSVTSYFPEDYKEAPAITCVATVLPHGLTLRNKATIELRHHICLEKPFRVRILYHSGLSTCEKGYQLLADLNQGAMSAVDGETEFRVERNCIRILCRGFSEHCIVQEGYFFISIRLYAPLSFAEGDSQGSVVASLSCQCDEVTKKIDKNQKELARECKDFQNDYINVDSTESVELSVNPTNDSSVLFSANGAPSSPAISAIALKSMIGAGHMNYITRSFCLERTKNTVVSVKFSYNAIDKTGSIVGSFQLYPVIWRPMPRLENLKSLLNGRSGTDNGSIHCSSVNAMVTQTAENQLDDVVSPDEQSDVARRIGSRWRHVGAALGPHPKFESHELDSFAAAHNSDRDRALQMLSTWAEKHHRNATRRMLILALRKEDQNALISNVFKCNPDSLTT